MSPAAAVFCQNLPTTYKSQKIQLEMSLNGIYKDAITLSSFHVAFSHMTASPSQVNGIFLK